MADAKVIRVELVAAPSSDSEPKESKEEKEKNNLTEALKNAKKFLHPVESIASIIDDKSKFAGAYFRQTVDILNSAMISETNRYFNLKEDFLSQMTIANVKTAVNKAKSFTNSVLTGAIVGSVGGPVLSVVSAGMSMGTWGINQFISSRNEMSSYYQSLNASNYQVNYSQIRAGLIDGGRGTEN